MSRHHYDAIGLLKPAKVTEAGYRLYGDDELARLQNILLFRELQFPLKHRSRTSSSYCLISVLSNASNVSCAFISIFTGSKRQLTAL